MSPCSLGWPLTHGNAPASPSRMMRLQAFTNTPDSQTNIFKRYSYGKQLFYKAFTKNMYKKIIFKGENVFYEFHLYLDHLSLVNYILICIKSAMRFHVFLNA